MPERPQSDPPTDIDDQCFARMRDQHLTSVGWRPESASRPPGGREAELARKCMGVWVAVYCTAASATSTIEPRF